MRQRRGIRARGIQADGFAMEGEPITPAARAAVARLLDPGEAEDGAVRFLLDGLEVGSLAELKQLVDAARDREPLPARLRRRPRRLRVVGRWDADGRDDRAYARAGRRPRGGDVELPPVDRARVDLLVRIEEARARGLIRDGGSWIYVTFDQDDGHPVNAAGFWASEADAMLAASSDPDPGIHRPLPLFVLNPR